MSLEKNLLLACEDLAQRERLGRHLSELGYHVLTAASLEEALAADTQQPSNLIICGWQMAGLSGPELINRLRRPNSRSRFIILTEPGERIDIMQATRNRVVAFLPHPYDLADLTRYVKSATELGDRPSNRREFSRYLFTMETHCILINPFNDSESRPIASIMRDISRSGLAMLVRQVVPVPAMLKVVVQLSGKNQPISMLGKSISCTLTQIPDVYRLGVKFVGLLPKDLETVITEMGRSVQPSPDIFVGRTFKDAIRDWLAQHPVEFAPAGDRQPSITEITEELFGEAAGIHESSSRISGNRVLPHDPEHDQAPRIVYSDRP